ncbi:MAG: hypothetical protein H7123_09645 [Thermoleophilia bacterium]|nr:hypothetical protein [Thermoleophilia bacterium]
MTYDTSTSNKTDLIVPRRTRVHLTFGARLSSTGSPDRMGDARRRAASGPHAATTGIPRSAQTAIGLSITRR